MTLHNKAHPILLIADQIPSDDRGNYKLAVVSAKSFLKILGIFFFKDCECSKKWNWRVPERGHWESWKEMRMRDWRGCGWRRQLDRIGSKASDEVIDSFCSLRSFVSLLRKSRRRIEIVCGYGLNRRLGLGRWTGEGVQEVCGREMNSSGRGTTVGKTEGYNQAVGERKEEKWDGREK